MCIQLQKELSKMQTLMHEVWVEAEILYFQELFMGKRLTWAQITLREKPVFKSSEPSF